MLAQVLAALHNGPLVRRDQALWTPEMFLPGYKPPTPDWKAQKAAAQLVASRKVDPKVRAAEAENIRVFMERQRRANQARDAGRPAEEIRAIMDGENG